MVYCKNCGAQISDNASFCTNCGQKVEKDLVCRNCNSKLKPETQFCTYCGTSVVKYNPPVQTLGRKKKSIKNIKKKVLISAVAIVLVASIILGIMYVPGMINRNKTYKTDQGKAQKGTVVTVQTDNPVVQAEGITVDFGSFAPQENIELEISQVNGATDEEMGEALASYRLTVDDEEHTEFASFIGITIPIDMTNYDDIDVCATYYDEDTSKWVMLPHETSKEENKIIIYTDHFSDFSVFNISRSNTRFASASLNTSVILEFFENNEYEKLYASLKAGGVPTDSDFITLALGFMNFTSTLYEGKITMTAILNNLPLSQVQVMSKTLTKIGFGLVLLKASYEFFVLDSADIAAQTLLVGLMELALFTAAGTIGGPIAATVALTVWAVSFLASVYSAYSYSQTIETAIKTQEDFINNLYLYCIDVRSGDKKGAWYYRYHSPVYESSGSGYIAFKAGSNSDWVKLFDKLYELNKDDPNAFLEAVVEAVNQYPSLWAATPVNARGNSWRDDSDPMRLVEYPSLYQDDEAIVTANVRENLRARLEPIIAEYKRKVFFTMVANYTISLEEIRDMWNTPITFEVLSDENDKFYDKYGSAVMRFAVPEELVTSMSEVEIAKYSNQWRFPPIEKDENPKFEGTYLGYFMAGMPTTLNIFFKDKNLESNLPERTVDFTFNMPDTVIVIPDKHPKFEEIIGTYVDGTLFIEYVYVGEHIDRKIARAQEKADNLAESIGCEAEEMKITLGEELEGETLFTSMSVYPFEDNNGYLYFDRIGSDDSYEFKYDDKTGALRFTEQHVEGVLIASYLPDKSGISIKGGIRIGLLGLNMVDYHVKLRATFSK